MKRKTIAIILIITLVVTALFYCFGGVVISWLFSEQYNEHGVSHFLVIHIDKDCSREYVGELDDHKIYIEGLRLEETNFRNIHAENVSIKEALEKHLVSIEDWKKYAWKRIKYDDIEILQYENYEIACSSEDCIIRPLNYGSRDVIMDNE